VRKTNKLNFFY